MVRIEELIDREATVALRLSIMNRADAIGAMYDNSRTELIRKMANLEHLCNELGMNAKSLLPSSYFKPKE